MTDGGTGRRSGLGRGLQALLPEAGEQPPVPDAAEWFTSAESPLSTRVADVVDTGLALLRQSLRLDVCAYAHAPGRGRPRMWLPDQPTSPLDPRGWSELGLATAGLLVTGLRGPRSLEVAGMELLAIPSRGAVSSGIHLVGRSRHPLDDRERSVAIHLVQALGEALHGLDPAEDDDAADLPAVPVPVIRVPDAQVPDAQVPDAQVPDARVPDAQVPAVGVPAVGVPAVAAETAVASGVRPREAFLVHWPAPDADRIEQVVHDAVHSSGVQHSELTVRRVVDGCSEMLDVSAAHRGDRVRVVLPADGSDPIVTAARAGRQAARLLELIGVPSAPREGQARRVAGVPA